MSSRAGDRPHTNPRLPVARWAVAVFLFVHSVLVMELLHWRGPLTLLTLAVCAVQSFAWLAAPARILWPALLVLLSVAVQIAAGIGVTLGDLTALYLVYCLVARGRRRPAALLTGVLAVLIGIAVWAHDPPWTAALGLALVTGCVLLVAAWTLGNNARLRAHHERALGERAEQLVREQEHLASLAAAEERTRIARDLHDTVSHNLAGVLTLTEGTLRTSTTLGDRDREVLGMIATSCRSSLVELRQMLHLLRDEPAEPATVAGLEADIRAVLDGLAGSGITPTLHVRGPRREVPAHVGEVVLRVVQESVTNVLKHAADASRAEVVLDFGGEELRLTIRDDGTSPAGARLPVGGFGLRGMRERVAAVHGAVRAAHHEDGGFEVAAVLPISPDRPRTARTAADGPQSPAGDGDAVTESLPTDRGPA